MQVQSCSKSFFFLNKNYSLYLRRLLRTEKQSSEVSGKWSQLTCMHADMQVSSENNQLVN